jgi:c-di-GMP-binding flagellar brake protein YcgR
MATRKLPPSVSRTLTTERRTPSVERRYLRAAVNLAAQYTIEGNVGWSQCMIDDLGGGGVRLLTEEDLAAGTTIALRFVVDGTPIVSTARVVMSLFDKSRDRYIHGAAFTAIQPAHRQTILNRVFALHGADRK